MDHTVRVWDAATGRLLLTLRRHETPVRSVAFSPDGRTIVSTDEGGAALLWQASDWSCEASHGERALQDGR